MKTHVLLKVTAFFAAVLLMTGCIFDSLNTEQTPLTATFGASFVNASEDGLQTKISLTQDGKNIDLAWESGDQIELLIDYNETLTKRYVTVVRVPGTENKQATFTFTLPTPAPGVTTFNLYGVYGGTVDENTGIVTLPNPENATSSSLKELQKNKGVVLVFEITNIELDNPRGNAEFKQIGSLFNIKLKNTSTLASEKITEASLKAATDIPAYNADDFQYNIIGKTFGGTKTQTLTFKPAVPSTYIGREGILEFWAWVPMEHGGNWPALDFSVDIAGAADVSYSDAKTGVASGQAYYLYATVDGTTLAKAGEGAITNPSSVTISGRVFERMADTRDGSVYRIVTIDTQTWMAENLRYYPTPNNGMWIYGNKEIISAEYQTYGVLYNWTTAMDGATGGSANPSGVQGICPKGWHLPSDAEYTQLEVYLANNGYNYDGSYGEDPPYDIRYKIGKSLASTSGWQTSTKEGGVGNDDFPDYRNKSGFTALPAGYRSTGSFFKEGAESYWWSATPNINQTAYTRSLHYFYSYITCNSVGKSSGHSVRCVRD